VTAKRRRVWRPLQALGGPRQVHHWPAGAELGAVAVAPTAADEDSLALIVGLSVGLLLGLMLLAAAAVVVAYHAGWSTAAGLQLPVFKWLGARASARAGADPEHGCCGGGGGADASKGGSGGGSSSGGGGGLDAAPSGRDAAKPGSRGAAALITLTGGGKAAGSSGSGSGAEAAGAGHGAPAAAPAAAGDAVPTQSDGQLTPAASATAYAAGHSSSGGGPKSGGSLRTQHLQLLGSLGAGSFGQVRYLAAAARLQLAPLGRLSVPHPAKQLC
jgi:hypothetical protein